MQTNPRSEVGAKCALTAKGIRYWAVAAEILELDANASYVPCPFKGETDQWMRNLTLAHELARTRSKPAALIVAYADGPFVTARRIKDLGGLPPLRPTAPQIAAVSYQEIVRLGRTVDAEGPWEVLKGWIDGKVEKATAYIHRRARGGARLTPWPTVP
jgi:hypothetical protein